jgi:hypothetical protein
MWMRRSLSLSLSTRACQESVRDEHASSRSMRFHGRYSWYSHVNEQLTRLSGPVLSETLNLIIIAYMHCLDFDMAIFQVVDNSIMHTSTHIFVVALSTLSYLSASQTWTTFVFFNIHSRIFMKCEQALITWRCSSFSSYLIGTLTNEDNPSTSIDIC